MECRWFTLLLGVALFQGALSFGPIDETDEAWIEYKNSRNTAICANYRLGTSVVPRNYAVHLTPHLSGEREFTFDGEVKIEVVVQTAGTNQIVMHCRDLTINPSTVTVTAPPTTAIPNPSNLYNAAASNLACNSPCNTFTIGTTTTFQQHQILHISMSFQGILQTNMRGFYRSWYIDETGQRRWMATTQFQPGHARQAFPCFDEPVFKATFDISITRDVEGFNQTITNMPLKTPGTPVNGKIREDFERTPPTSTYLLAFIVSGYKKVASNNDAVRPFEIYSRANIGNAGDYALAVGVELLKTMEQYTAYNYYQLQASGVTYNMNMKQAAIPDFSAGAMENWGILTYREALILYDPEDTNNFYKQRIANIIAHEIAHMWFGNLVTCAWWDNLWLNEGFARYYQYYLTHKVEPDMGFDIRFITEQLHVSMLADSHQSAHALTNPAVGSPATVSAQFSTITYAKGASIIRMTQHLLGDDVFENALRTYLRQNEFGVALPSNLFSALQTAAGTVFTNTYGITVAEYFTSWTLKGGLPLLNVVVNHDTGIMSVTQSRFFRDAGVPESSDLWNIPITWTRGGSPDFTTFRPATMMSTRDASINRESTGREWVIFNKQQIGFYRVNYDDITWGLITRALRGSEREIIHEFNRAQIVDDVFLLARSGHLTYTKAFNILSFLKFEDQYAPWLAAITGFNFARRALAHDSLASRNLREEIIDSSTTVVARLGFNETDKPRHFMDDLFRMHLATLLCNVGHQGCIDTAVRFFQQWRNGGRVPPNMRQWVYCNGLRYGTVADYDFLWAKYLESNVANDQLVMLSAAGCTLHQPSLNRFLANIASGSYNNFNVRPQDYSAAISSAITSNEENTWRVFQWLQTNVNFLRANATGIDQTSSIINTMISSVTSRLLTEADITAVETWVRANQERLSPAAFSSANTGLATSRSNLQFYRDRVQEFNSYFANGFDDVLDPSTPAPTDATTTTLTPPTTESTSTVAPTTPTSTESTSTSTEPSTSTSTSTETSTSTSTEASTEPATTPAPDSANIAALSTVTLIVTLIINMA